MTNIEKIKAEIERRMEFEQQNIDEFIKNGCEGDAPITSEAIRLTMQGLLLFINGLEKEDPLANIPHWKPGEWQPTGKYLTDETVETSDGEQWVVADSDGNARITVKLKTAMVAIFLWMLFCIAIGIIGIVNWVTTVSNVFFALFMLWMMNHERKQIENRKED